MTAASTISAAQSLLAATLATFAPVPDDLAEGATIKAVKGDRISLMLADDSVSDIVTVIMVKKDDVIGSSLVNGATIRLPLEYTAGGAEHDNETTAMLYKAPTPPAGTELSAVVKKKGGKRVAGEPTKFQKCKAIYEDPKNVDLDKKELCKLFQSEAACTRMGANTYFLTIHKDATAAGTALKIIPKEDPQVAAALAATGADKAEDAAAGEKTESSAEATA